MHLTAILCVTLKYLHVTWYFLISWKIQQIVCRLKTVFWQNLADVCIYFVIKIVKCIPYLIIYFYSLHYTVSCEFLYFRIKLTINLICCWYFLAAYDWSSPSCDLCYSDISVWIIVLMPFLMQWIFLLYCFWSVLFTP